MANCLNIHDSYVTNFDFVNYGFAELVVALLYQYCKLFLPPLYGMSPTVFFSTQLYSGPIQYHYIRADRINTQVIYRFLVPDSFVNKT